MKKGSDPFFNGLYGFWILPQTGLLECAKCADSDRVLSDCRSGNGIHLKILRVDDRLRHSHAGVLVDLFLMLDADVGDATSLNLNGQVDIAGAAKSLRAVGTRRITVALIEQNSVTARRLTNSSRKYST